MIPLRVLIIEDSEDDALLLLHELRRGGYVPEYERVETAATMESALSKAAWDIVISDYFMPHFSGLTALKLLKERGLDKPFLIVSGTINEEMAVAAMKAGAHDYLMKHNMARLVPAVERELREAAVRQQQQLAQEQIREQAALLDVAQDAIFVQDLEERICFWNKSAERLYGWSAQEAVGRKASLLLFAEHSPEFLTLPGVKPLGYPDTSLLIDIGEWQGGFHQVTKDGKEIVVESRWKLMCDREGQPKSILVVNTNITEKKQLEKQFLRAQRMESIGTLAGGIAHDLNNVLSPILMALEILKLRIPDRESKKMLEVLESSARRGADIVRQVLGFARGLEGKHAELQVRHLIREIAKMAKETFPKSIEVSANTPRDLWMLSGDATQLQQVLLNLCVNARDAMPNGGTLRIKAENVCLDENYVGMNPEAKVGPYVLLTVSDTGMGIPADIIEQIFEPFFTTKPVGQGTGLGLSTVMTIVKSYGGFIKIDTQVGKGTRFEIYLPALDTTTKLQPEEVEEEDLPSGSGESVLVVDDEASICDIAKQTLKTFGYSVLTAENGTEAFTLYVQHQKKIQVAVVDMKMPVMDGPTTIRALRTINPQLKIIVTSGLTLGGQSAELESVNAQAILPKPYTADILLKTIYRVLNA